MSRVPLQTIGGNAKRSGPEGRLQHPTGPDHGDLSEEIANMADASQYPDSARSCKPDNWVPIGGMVRRIVAGWQA